MVKRKRYESTRFSADIIRSATSRFLDLCKQPKLKPTLELECWFPPVDWAYDSQEEFFADYMRQPAGARYHLYVDSGHTFMVHYERGATRVVVEMPTRQDIEAIHNVFEEAAEDSRTSEQEKADVKVFIGHGRNPSWRDLKDHLAEKHGYEVVAYEIGARAGHAVRDVLEDMLMQSSFALLVFTGEDEQSDGGMRARQNVVHETGLFQGKLGFSRAIVLVEDRVETFSNIEGIEQIRFSPGNIRETFGDVVATIRREFEDH